MPPFPTAAYAFKAPPKPETLLEFIPRVSGKAPTPLGAPTWLSPYLDVFEAAFRGPIEVCLSAPPQHGKTETTLHGIALYMLRHPARRNAYVTFAQTRADKVSDDFRRIAERAGLKLSGTKTRLTTAQGGQIRFVGIEGALTGDPIDGLLVVDDPISGRSDAESTTVRESTWSSFTDVAMTRCHPSASKIVMMTRWHPDDTIGRLTGAKIGWRYVNLPAINEAGEALWPAMRPIAELEKHRKIQGEYGFASMYLGRPMARGSAVFHDPTFYDVRDLPTSFRASIGVDFAYSTKTHADYSVCVVLAQAFGCIYVLDVKRQQVEAPAFGGTVRPIQQRYGVPCTAFIGGTEKGIVDFWTSQGIRVNAINASGNGDKFTRAQPVAAAWNEGKVKVPLGADWLNDFTAEITSFTGLGDKHDDQVDALASAHFALAQPRLTRNDYGPEDFTFG